MKPLNPNDMKKLLGLLLVSCAFLVASTYSVTGSPSYGVHSNIVKQDLLFTADFTPALRVNPQYGEPVMVYALNIKLCNFPKEVVPTANSPPRYRRGASY